MRVDVILKLVAGLTPADRDDLFARLRTLYPAPDAEDALADDPPPAPRPDQTGVYSLDQVANRIRRTE